MLIDPPLPELPRPVDELELVSPKIVVVPGDEMSIDPPLPAVPVSTLALLVIFPVLMILPLVVRRVILPPFRVAMLVYVSIPAAVIFAAMIVKFLPLAVMLLPLVLNAPPAVKEIGDVGQVTIGHAAKITGTLKVILLLA